MEDPVYVGITKEKSFIASQMLQNGGLHAIEWDNAPISDEPQYNLIYKMSYGGNVDVNPLPKPDTILGEMDNKKFAYQDNAFSFASIEFKK